MMRNIHLNEKLPAPRISTRISTRRGRFMFKALTWTVIAIVLIALFTAMTVLTIGGATPIASIEAWLRQIKPYACVMHFLLIGWLWWKWHAVIAWLHATGRIHPSMKEAILASRNRTILMLLAVEILVVMELPVSVIRMMQ